MSVNLISSNDININQTNDDIELDFSSTRQQELLDIKNDIENLQNYTSDISTYSTTEHIVGKWIDGKPIYRKVYVINNPAVGNVNHAHNISNFETLISATANGIQTNGGQQYFPRAVPGDSNWSLNIGDVNSTTFSLQIANNNTGNYAFTKVNVILEYTKTTD